MKQEKQFFISLQKLIQTYSNYNDVSKYVGMKHKTRSQKLGR